MSGIYVELDMLNNFLNDFNFINFIKKKSNPSSNKPCYFTTNKKENVTIEFLKNPYFDLSDFLKNNQNLSDIKIKKIGKLKPNCLLKIKKTSLHSSFFVYHLSQEDLIFLKSGQKIYDELLDVNKQIKDLIPDTLLIRQKELEKQKRQYLK